MDSNDPQITKEIVTSRQETLLHELAARVRVHTGLKQDQLHDKPLIILMTKSDAWSDLLDDHSPDLPILASKTADDWHGLDLERIERVSDSARRLMQRFSAEFVQGADALSSRVIYMPVSAFGAAPQQDQDTGLLGITPGDIAPNWCDVPILWALTQRSAGLVPRTDPKTAAQQA
jgi:hypothetical protein